MEQKLVRLPLVLAVYAKEWMVVPRFLLLVIVTNLGHTSLNLRALLVTVVPRPLVAAFIRTRTLTGLTAVFSPLRIPPRPVVRMDLVPEVVLNNPRTRGRFLRVVPVVQVVQAVEVASLFATVVPRPLTAPATGNKPTTTSKRRNQKNFLREEKM